MNYSKYINQLPTRARKRTLLTESSKDSAYVYKYSCAMLNLSDSIASEISEWSHNNINEDCLYINLDDGIEGYEDTPHVTIKYGLHDVVPDNLIKIVTGFGPINIKLDTIDIFNTNPNFDVLKINIISDRLMELNQLICNTMQYTDKFPVYIPHATLAYIKKGTCTKLINSTVFDKLEDVIDEIYFTSRSGDEFFIQL